MTGTAPAHLVSAMRWDEVARRIERGALAILPVGAGAKQHGLHLPMGTDALQAEWFAARLAERTAALVWPVLTYGTYPAFTAYPGSISLSSVALETVVAEIAAGLTGYGVRGVLILNSGISTMAPIDRAIARVSRSGRIRQAAIWSGPRCLEMIAQLRQQQHGSHADEFETSLMLVIAPETVAMERAVASPPLPGGTRPGALTPTEPSSPNYSPSGSFGDPTLATVEKGKAIVAAILADLAAAAEVLMTE